MKNGIYPIVERDERGLTKSNGKGLALFDIGDKYDPITAIVRTLYVSELDPREPEYVKKIRSRGLWTAFEEVLEKNPNYPKRKNVLRLEGDEERPNMLYVNSRLKRNRDPYETFFIGNFLSENEELITTPGRFLAFDDKNPWISGFIQPIKIENIDQYDLDNQFRFWKINPRRYEHLFGNFVELARHFVDNSGGRK